MTLFYRGPSARITHEVFETHTPYYQSYLISELYLAHVIREPIADVAMGSPTVRVCSSAMSGLSVVVAAIGSHVSDSPSTTVVATVVATTSALVAVVGWRARHRPIGLWAFHNGRRVCLFETRDRLEFGQVKRALLRALEYIDDSRP